jgi:hypothetical protein
MKIRRIVAGAVAAAFLGGFGGAQDAPDPRTPETLKAEIEALKATDLAWSKIAWENCVLEALQASREKKKPVIVWIFLGNPSDERC